jgi:hypothetical protein
MNHQLHDNVIDALMASAVLPNLLNEPSLEEMDSYIAQAASVPHNKENDDAWERVEQLLKARIAGKAQARSFTRNAMSIAIAMNRKSEDDTFTAETIAGIEQARTKALERLQNEKGLAND